jgi:hypothetical protein
VLDTALPIGADTDARYVTADASVGFQVGPRQTESRAAIR